MLSRSDLVFCVSPAKENMSVTLCPSVCFLSKIGLDDLRVGTDDLGGLFNLNDSLVLSVSVYWCLVSTKLYLGLKGLRINQVGRTLTGGSRSYHMLGRQGGVCEEKP